MPYDVPLENVQQVTDAMDWYYENFPEFPAGMENA